MANELQIVQDKPTGRLSLKHKAALVAVGNLFIWIGNCLKRVETYEQFEELVPRVEDRLKELDQYEEELKALER